MTLQGLQLAVDRLALEIAAQRQEAEAAGRFAGLPEWLDLEQCLALKRGLSAPKKRENGNTRIEDDAFSGGASLIFYRQKLFLQPCCGLNYKTVGGRRGWKKDDVIAWLAITDEELKKYADKHRVTLPDIYQNRSA